MDELDPTGRDRCQDARAGPEGLDERILDRPWSTPPEPLQAPRGGDGEGIGWSVHLGRIVRVLGW